MSIERCCKEYQPSEYKKAAVIARFNEVHTVGKAVDWGELFAELIEAYIEAKKPVEITRKGDPA